ncbi:MAG TPA: glutathione S-transferase family protein [Caulobacteraceae bacterium]|nr:glutathione S-transferase family protein [Caulobacteraceae bacterium]
MITIYGDPISGNCLKVKWTAERLGVPFAWKNIDIMRGESRTASFLAMNPAGQVPVVAFADGRHLAQSNAIILHLAEGSSLVPGDAYERAKMLEWMFWEQYSHEPAVAVARFQIKYLGKRRAELDPKLLERGDSALRRLDAGLAGRDYLASNALTLADIALVAYTRMAHDGGFQLSDYPSVEAWVERIEAELPIGDPR